MPDILSVIERGLKAVRLAVFQASDNVAFLLDGLCRAPEPFEPPKLPNWAPVVDFTNKTSAVASPTRAADEDPAGSVLAEAPEATPAASLPGHPTITGEWGAELAHFVGELQDAIVDNYDHGRVDAPVDTGWLSSSVDWKSAAATLIDSFDISRKPPRWSSGFR